MGKPEPNPTIMAQIFCMTLCKSNKPHPVVQFESASKVSQMHFDPTWRHERADVHLTLSELASVAWVQVRH